MPPNKPQLAFAWMGERRALTSLWDAMARTPSQGAAPRELLHRPQIIAVETETWSYRFSRCDALAALLYMRVNARRHCGLLWCKESGGHPSAEEYKMLCYAGGCGLPVVVVVQGAQEGSEAAEQEELRVRPLLDELGLQADEALFVYSATAEDALPHLYQTLDQALTATAERSLPPLMLRVEEADLLLFIDAPTRRVESGPYRLTLQAPGLSLKLSAEQHLRASTSNDTKQKNRQLTALTLRVTFETPLSLRPEALFSGRLHDQETGDLLLEGCLVSR